MQCLLHSSAEPSADSLIPSNQSTTFSQTFISWHLVSESHSEEMLNQVQHDECTKPYKSSGGKMEYNEVLKREIPAGWEVGNLYDIAEYVNGLACQNYRPKAEEAFCQ